ncbi:MAG: MoaD/ThiS family protein [Campylobacteraceae bacterium]
MATVEFLGPIAREPMKVDIKNLKELKEILKDDADIKSWLEVCSIALNDELVSDINTKVNENDKIVLLPPVCGGSHA